MVVRLRAGDVFWEAAHLRSEVHLTQFLFCP